MFPEQGKTIEAGGVATNYFEFGESGRAPDVILLHGSGPGVTAWGNWAGVAARLAAGRRVLAPDIVGFGFTDAPEGVELNIKVWVRHLIDFMDAKQVSRAVLVGNSFGGGLSLAASLRHRERVAGLVLMGTPCGAFEQTRPLASTYDFEPSLEAMTQLLRSFPYDSSVVTPAMAQSRYQIASRRSAQSAIQKLQPKPEGEAKPAIVRGVPEEQVATIEAPALVLHGREDKVIPIEVGMRAHRALKNSDFMSFGQCGHWVQLERADDFIAHCQRFLSRIEVAA